MSIQSLESLLLIKMSIQSSQSSKNPESLLVQLVNQDVQPKFGKVFLFN
jgi:hypothetical protein